MVIKVCVQRLTVNKLEEGCLVHHRNIIPAPNIDHPCLDLSHSKSMFLFLLFERMMRVVASLCGCVRLLPQSKEILILLVVTKHERFGILKIVRGIVKEQNDKKKQSSPKSVSSKILVWVK